MARTPSLSMIVLAFFSAACHPATRAAIAPTPNVAIQSDPVLADSAAATKATLELERLRMLTIYEPWSKQVREIEDRIFAADLRLLRVPPTAALAAMDQVLLKLDQREAGLTAEIDQLLVKYKGDAAPVQLAEEEMRQLLVRRMELKVQKGLYNAR